MRFSCAVVCREHLGQVYGSGILGDHLEAARDLGLVQAGLDPKLAFHVLTNRPPCPREVSRCSGLVLAEQVPGLGERQGLAIVAAQAQPIARVEPGDREAERPLNERAIMLVVAGYPAPGVRVPDLRRKPLSAIATFREAAGADA